MMYRGLNVTWLVFLLEVGYTALIFVLGFIAGRYL